MTDFPTLSNQVYASRETIRDQIIEYMKSYLDLEGIDLTKTSFVSFLINLLSVLTANLHFYTSSVYREFFLTQAQLPESVFSLAAYLGYSPRSAIPASGDVLIAMTLNFEQDNKIVMEKGFTFSSGGDAKCSTYYETIIDITNTVFGDPNIEVKIKNDQKSYNIPVIIDQTGGNIAYFVLPVKQYSEEYQEFSISSDIGKYQFSSIDVFFDGQLSDIRLYIQEPGGVSELYNNYNSLFLMESTTKGYVYRKTGGGIRIYFGNGLIGYQPPSGSKVQIYIEKTLGASGNIVAYGITQGESIYVNSPSGAKLLDYMVSNPSPISGGEDEESLEEIRKNAIDHLTARMRLVSENDFKVASNILPQLSIKYSYPVLKRSDLKTNEIQMFTVLRHGESDPIDIHKDVIPTRNLYHTFPRAVSKIPKNTEIIFEDSTYVTIFDMEVNTSDLSTLLIDERVYKVSLSDSNETNPIINLGLNYTPGKNELEVYQNGVLLLKKIVDGGNQYGHYEEISSTSLKFETGVLHKDDILYIRKLPATEKDFFCPIDTTNEMFNEIIEADFIFNKDTELRVFKNGVIQKGGNNAVDDFYQIDWLHSSISIKPNQIQFGDIIRIKSISSIIPKESHLTLTNSEVNLKFITLNISDREYIEVYKNGKILTPVLFSTNNGLIGDFYRVSNGVYFNCNVNVGDKILIRHFPISDSKSFSFGFLDYIYRIENLSIIPSLTFRSPNYPDFRINSLNVRVSEDNGIEFELHYPEFEDCTSANCQMKILEIHKDYSMDNITDEKFFYYKFPSFENFPIGTLNYEFLISDILGNLIAEYSVSLVVKKKLEMFSNISVDSTGVTVYDIPAIEKNFFETMIPKDFELYLQTMLKILEWPIYRMLTDNINLKFANTVGNLKAMQANKHTLTVKKFITDTDLLSQNQIVGNKFILSEEIQSEIWKDFKNYVIEWNGSEWVPRKALTDTIALNLEDNFKYVFNGDEWIKAIFEIPLKIEIEVFKENSYLGSDSELSENIKRALLNEFNHRFGINVQLYTSEIISVVQNVYGVHHCNLIYPRCNLFFEISPYDNLSQEELLKYSPDFVFFTSDTISIKILSSLGV